MPSNADAAVLKEARDRCYQARDAFFACIEESGEQFVLGGPYPKQCIKFREQFEKSCKASWVSHFDRLQDKKLRLLQTLQHNISRSSKDALGSVQGEPQH